MVKKLRSYVYKLLRWTEKWMKADMIYVFRGMSWLTIGKISYIFFNLILSIIFANLLSKETYGNYKYIISIFGIITMSTLPGMGTAIIQSVARGFEGSFFQAIKKEIKWGGQ